MARYASIFTYAKIPHRTQLRNAYLVLLVKLHSSTIFTSISIILTLGTPKLKYKVHIQTHIAPQHGPEFHHILLGSITDDVAFKCTAVEKKQMKAGVNNNHPYLWLW